MYLGDKMSESLFITCHHCFAKNRIPAERLDAAPKCGKCKQPVLEAAPIELNDNNFFRFIQNNDLPIVVDFWASWCGPCQTMAPIFDKVSRQVAPNFRFAKVNTETAQQVAAHFQIRSIPTLMMFKQGQVVKNQAGAMMEPQLTSWLNSI